ncbi:hypothetical protein [Bradyrhizobium oligotrophicum]|uniref:hypothetical protein n=1 Tax=Bradyrhizobium TaxID=374 RepID=UPI003EB95F6D
MTRLVLIMLVLGQFASVPLAAAQTAPKQSTAKRADACAPIGRTEDGKLVYAMKCESIPKPVAPAAPPQAAAQPSEPAAEPEPETQRSGVFGWSYDRRPKR